MNTVGLLVKQLRVQKGITQIELLNDKYSTTYLSRIENGQIHPSKSFIEFVANRLNIPAQDLYLNRSFDENEIMRIYREFRERGSVTEKDISLLSIYACQSFSTTSYLRIYSILIRYRLKFHLYKEAKKVILQSKRFLTDIETMNNTGEELPYFLIACGNFYFITQDFFKADEYYTKAIKLNLAKEDLADLFYNISITKQRTLPNIETSLYYSNMAYNLYAELHLVYKQHRTIITIALQNNLLGNNKVAIEQLNKVKSYMSSIRDVEMLSKIEYNLGNIQHKIGNYKQALNHYNKGLEYLTIIDLNKGKFYVYRNLTLLYLDLKNFPMVDQYTEKAFDVINKEIHPYSFNEMLSIKAKVLNLKGEGKLYQSIMEKAIENCIHSNLQTLANKLSAELGKHYYQNNRYKKAAQYLLNLLD